MEPGDLQTKMLERRNSFLNIRDKFIHLGQRKPIIKLYRDDERKAYMDAHIDLSFPNIVRKEKLRLDSEVDYQTLATEFEKTRSGSI